MTMSCHGRRRLVLAFAAALAGKLRSAQAVLPLAACANRRGACFLSWVVGDDWCTRVCHFFVRVFIFLEASARLSNRL
jgi:hypothetical protein